MLGRLIISFMLLLGVRAHAADGKLEVRYVSGAWQVSKPDNSTLTISQATFGLPEALAYANSSGNPPLTVYCGGPGAPLSFPANYTLDIPASVGQKIAWSGCSLEFTNEAQPGVRADTVSYGAFVNTGNQIRYSGTGPAVLLRPCTAIPSAEVAIVYTTWTRNHAFDFGTIIATGGTPEALLKIDPTCNDSSDPFLASGVVTNLANPIRFVGECRGRAKHALLLVSPVTGRQLVAQNKFVFYAETCTEEIIKIGGAGAFDTGLGSNVYEGNPTKTVSGAFPVVYTNAPFSYFRFNSANDESAGGTPYNFVFGPKAYANTVCTRQSFGWTVALALDQNANPSQPNTFDCGIPTALPSNFEGTSGTPAGSTSMGSFTYVDRSWQVDNGRTVTKLWLNTTTAGTYPLKIVRRNSAGNYDVVASQSITHGGGGLESITLGSAYAVANDGLEYFVGVYTTGASHPTLDNKARSYVAADAAGNGVTMTEQAAQSGWHILAVGVTYQ